MKKNPKPLFGVFALSVSLFHRPPPCLELMTMELAVAWVSNLMILTPFVWRGEPLMLFPPLVLCVYSQGKCSPFLFIFHDTKDWVVSALFPLSFFPVQFAFNFLFYPTLNYVHTYVGMQEKLFLLAGRTSWMEKERGKFHFCRKVFPTHHLRMVWLLPTIATLK